MSIKNFVGLLDQYKQLAFPDTKETTLAATFELLESIDHVKSIPDQQVIDILVLGCKSLGYQHASSRAFCQFIYKQAAKQIRVTNFRPSQFDTCIKYLLDGLDFVQDADYKVDLLRALGALVFENAANTQRWGTRLSSTLLLLADKSTKPLEVRRMAINCIGNTCAGGGTKLLSLYKDFYACLLGNLCTVDHTAQGTIMVASTSLDFTDTAVRKVASSTLRALQFLLCQDKSLVTNPLCDIIEIIRTFIFMSVSVQFYSTINPSTPHIRRNRLSQPTSQYQFSWRTPINKQPSTSSESELSDSTSLNELSPRRQRDNAKIRINALLCLSAIANTSPKSLYPHWHKFLPDTFSVFLANHGGDTLLPFLRSDNQPLSLFTILLYDPMVTVRAAVCSTLIAMLDGSKQYLSLALESEKSHSSFTSLSENLGSIIHDVHRGIIYALAKEQTNQVLSMLMNVTTVLVENCSYERLSKKHLVSLYQAVVPHWKEPILRSCVLKVIASIFCIEQENLKPLSIELVDTLLLQAVQDPNEDIQIEGWRTCTVLAKTYFNATLWDKLKDHFVISSASLKFAETYASVMGENPVDLLWWQHMMENYLQQASSNAMASVRAAACDCFASVSRNIFEQFHVRYQRLAVTLLFSMCSDTDSNVRAAACRALGVFVLFPSLREDPMFVSDMTKAILLQKEDKTILVRVRASWAIANLCDALVLECGEKLDFSLREYMSTTEWIEVLSTATNGALDNEKLRSNAVRAIGSLLRITPLEYYENTRIMSLVCNAMDGLVKNIETGSLKTRWNACHATSNMLLNPHFPIGFMKQGGIYPWTQSLFQALIQSLNHCKNFKVRINACLAMTTPLQQNQYGDRLPWIIKSILDAWDTCQENQEYKEIKYKNQLEQQIIKSLNHLGDWIPLNYRDKVNEILLNHMTV